LHLLWWVGAFLRPSDARAPLRLRRALVLLVGMPAFLFVQLVHTVCLLLDDVLFPRYRRVTVGKALFITGIPRSGTTALHRTIATNRRRYTTLTTWEALFAPSIVQRRLIHASGWLDARCGSYGRRALASLTRRMTGGLSAIHTVGLEAAEGVSPRECSVCGPTSLSRSRPDLSACSGFGWPGDTAVGSCLPTTRVSRPWPIYRLYRLASGTAGAVGASAESEH